MDRLRSHSSLNTLSARRLAAVDLRQSFSTPSTRSTGAAVLTPVPDTKRLTALFVSLFLLSAAVIIHGNRTASAGELIVFRAASSAANGGGPTLSLSTPSGVQRGDLMLAGLFDRGSPAVTPPLGWTFIRHDVHGNVYFRFATHSEPSSYTWRFSPPKPVVGAMVVYSGVDVDPVAASSGRRNSASYRISAPSAVVDTPGSMIVGFFGMARLTKITRPYGMTRRALVRSGSGPAVAIEVTDFVRNETGPTGRKVARASMIAPNVGELVVLSPLKRKKLPPPSPSPSPSDSPPLPSHPPTPPPPPPGGLAIPVYASDSFWNTPIPANPAIDPNSAGMVKAALLSYVGSAHFSNTGSWGRYIWLGKPSDKLYHVCSSKTCVDVRIPAAAKPNTGSDHHMVVVNGDVETDMWIARYDSSTDTWSASWIGNTTITGWGAHCALGQHCNGPTAAGFALVGGVARPAEIMQGHIDHAFKLDSPYSRSGIIACPATHTDGKFPDPVALPEGARIQLDPAINVEAQAWAPWQKIVAKALQKYGAYMSDTGGSLSLKGESDQDGAHGDSWAAVGVPAGPSLGWLPWSKMRVLKIESC
ncbi:MAG TPA: hypothetical protein VEQ37_16770 [Actinomycetota bacterium]|nr:hypothetical protein [Actinomycetota bacterium]